MLKTSVILLFGGKGTRMNSSVPKQYLKIKNKIIALYSFDFFCSLKETEEIIVVCDPQYQKLFTHEKLSSFALPGKRRQDSVLNGLNKTNKKAKLICIHDGARPFLNEKEIKETILEASHHGAAALGAKVTNTLKQANTNLFIKKTMERKELYEIYTPQIIKRDWLIQGFAFAHQNQIEVTDDLSLIEPLGYQAKIVEGTSTNLKITKALDLKIAEAMFSL